MDSNITKISLKILEKMCDPLLEYLTKKYDTPLFGAHFH